MRERRLFIECTFMYHGKIKTGVPRVLYGIVNTGGRTARDFKMALIPVETRAGKLYEKSIDKCQNAPLLRKPFIGRLIDRWNRYFQVPITPSEGDILLMVEHWNGIRHMNVVRRFKSSGGKVVYMIHDLIPIRYPEFCGSAVVIDFEHWFRETMKYADGYIAISKTVMEDVQSYIAAQGSDTRCYFFDYFRLGAEQRAPVAEPIPERFPELRSLFDTGKSVYLTVSTIEPRKNHRYLLETFDRLWKRGVDAVLLIVGQIGWQVEPLIADIRSHSQFGTRLIMMNDLDDEGLSYCYRHAKALLFPSYTEGFGLPIIESLQAGLPVFASDIPVHREVGGSNIDYFDINEPDALAERIEAVETHRIFLKNLRETPVHVTSWEESTRELFAKISCH